MFQKLPCYADTDSVKIAKTMLNSVYGKAVTEMETTRNYIVVHNADEPVIIFKNSISAIERAKDDSAIIYSTAAKFYVDEKYADVVKQLV